MAGPHAPGVAGLLTPKLYRLGTWIGGDDRTADAYYQQALALGMTKNRALVVAHIASRKDCWAWARTIAERVRCSVRTVQRAIAQAKSLGLLRTWHGKKGEIPPGAEASFVCGFSHRSVIGRGLAAVARLAEIAKERIAFLGRFDRRRKGNCPKSERDLAQRARTVEPRKAPPGMSTQEWLDRELAEVRRQQSRDGP